MSGDPLADAIMILGAIVTLVAIVIVVREQVRYYRDHRPRRNRYLDKPREDSRSSIHQFNRIIGR